MAEKEFPKGIYWNKPRENAPSFVIGSIALNLSGMDREQLNAKKNDSGYVYIDVLEGRDGKAYCAFNNYIPLAKKESRESKYGGNEMTIDDVSF